MYWFRLGLLCSLGVFVSIASATEHHPEAFLASIQGSPTAGEQIYTHFCANCHAEKPFIPVHAPCIGKAADWAPFTQSQTAEQMLKVVDVGYGAMPPRGGCFECSDDDLKAAITFMLPK